MRDDLTFAVRQLWRAPGFALVAAATLALGIGVNSAIFALVDAVLLRPLPLHEPDRLVMVWERTGGTLRGAVAAADLADWNERSRAFESLAGYVPGVGGMVMAGADGQAETVPRQWVTPGIFETLAVTPVAGRLFLPDEGVPQRAAVILSESFWRARYGGDRSIVGSQIRLDGDPFTVVGVVPEAAQLVGATSLWAAVPLNRNPAARAQRMLRVVGRMRPGVTLDAAAADLGVVADQLAAEFPATNRGRGVRLEPLRDAMIGADLRVTSLLFLGVVGFVLLVCCANVANLLLARATVRARELAVRAALGAGRGRMIRQLLTESLVLAALGGALGAGVGAAILRAAPAVLPDGLLPGAASLAFDARVTAFCAVAAVLAGLVFGIVPAWQAASLPAAAVVGADSRGSTRRGGRTRSALVAAEVAAATLLLCGAGLLLRTLMAVERVDRGYRAESVLTMLVDPLGSRYPTPEALRRFFDEVEAEIRAVPGVRDLAWASTLPLGPSDAGRVSFEIPGLPPVDESRRPTADYQIVSPSYFSALDLPVLAGRAFTAGDTTDSGRVCIVNEAFARAMLPGQSPLGQRVALRPAAAPSVPPRVHEIVGVARQVKGRPDEAEDLLQVYVPQAQDLRDDIYLLVRPASGPADALTRGVRAAIARVDRDQLVSVRDVMTLDEVAGAATARHRFRALMVGAFAALALTLAMVGVFGILAYSVQQRVRELGVRMALGASRLELVALVTAGAARVIAAGAAIGLMLSAALARFMAAMLYGVEPLDPAAFVASALVVGATAILAAAVPAWRAVRVDPAIALRAE